MHPRAAELIAALDLRPHPEGGFYRQIFRSAMQVSPMDGRSPRAALTTIYFLLTEGSFSRWHQVASDEVWHLYEGGPLELLELGAQVSPSCVIGWVELTAGQTHRFARSVPGFGKQHGR